MGLESGHDAVSWTVPHPNVKLTSSDLLAHQPDTPLPLVIAPSSNSSSPTRRHEPRTPVTVTSSFDAQWEAARKELEAKKAQGTPAVARAQLPEEKEPTAEQNGHNGAGLAKKAALGSQVDTKTLKGRRRRGVGPGVT